MTDTPYAGMRILVLGLGIEGVALTRFFAARGARVTVSDTRTREQLAARRAELGGVPFTLVCGPHHPALAADADALYLSQSRSPDLPLAEAARARGLPVGTITTLLYEICRGRLVAITGSSGKTTTTSLVAAIFKESGLPFLLAGNIGTWPLDELERIPPDTWVVLELSHTQLQLTTRSPRVACVTNVTPNHLDEFSWEAYQDLKRNLIRHQRPGDLAVLNWDNALTRAFRRETAAETLYFSMQGDVPADGVFLRDERIVWRRNGQDEAVLAAAEIPLRGRHNVENVLAATAIAGACAVPMAAVARAVRGFTGVPHRLEVVGTVGGVTYVNDSIATAPERTLAGMAAFPEPIVLLLGGRDKHLSLAGLAAEAVHRCRAVITFGEAGALFAAELRAAWSTGGPALEQVAALPEAVARAAAVAQPGDAVLLAPAGTSFDAYPNFERRGEHFRMLVTSLSPQQTFLSTRHAACSTETAPPRTGVPL